MPVFCVAGSTLSSSLATLSAAVWPDEASVVFCASVTFCSASAVLAAASSRAALAELKLFDADL